MQNDNFPPKIQLKNLTLSHRLGFDPKEALTINQYPPYKRISTLSINREIDSKNTACNVFIETKQRVTNFQESLFKLQQKEYVLTMYLNICVIDNFR